MPPGGILDKTGPYVGMTVSAYLEELSGRKMTPGGGSASALAAALGAGLIMMVVNYAVKPCLERAEDDDLISLRDRQARIRDRLAALIDEDCDAFASLMMALKEKKDPEEKYKAAAKAPLEVCRASRDSMAIAETAASFTKKDLSSDIGCASHILKAAFYAARLNVNINMEHISDTVFVDDARKDLAAMSADVEAMSANISKIME